jgi:hypothetical protein
LPELSLVAVIPDAVTVTPEIADPVDAFVILPVMVPVVAVGVRETFFVSDCPAVMVTEDDALLYELAEMESVCVPAAIDVIVYVPVESVLPVFPPQLTAAAEMAAPVEALVIFPVIVPVVGTAVSAKLLLVV